MRYVLVPTDTQHLLALCHDDAVGFTLEYYFAKNGYNISKVSREELRSPVNSVTYLNGVEDVWDTLGRVVFGTQQSNLLPEPDYEQLSELTSEVTGIMQVMKKIKVSP